MVSSCPKMLDSRERNGAAASLAGNAAATSKGLHDALKVGGAKVAEMLGGCSKHMERIMKEIRRRTNVVGSFPDGYSALMLVCSRLRYITTHSWGVRRYINMNLLSESCGNDSEADIA